MGLLYSTLLPLALHTNLKPNTGVSDMRVISRNCYRKIAVGIVFTVFFVLILSQSQRLANTAIKQQSSATKNDKNWEWSPEKLNEFMHLLDKHKESVDNNVLQLIQPTSNASNLDNKLQFPALSKYLQYITDEETALMPALTLSHRPPNKKG